MDPFDGAETPLGTRDVLDFINGNKGIVPGIRRTESGTIYSIPVHLKYNHLLFVEKQGFNAVMQEAGLVDELNLALISTQGFGTRAAKKLIQWLMEQGIKVYVLHDCDVAGYLIRDKLQGGSNTFKQGLDVEDIGLTVDDVVDLGKRHQAETYRKTRPYTYELLNKVLDDHERDFLVAGQRTYRRVELNALTNPEFIKFVRQKVTAIKPDPIMLTVDELKRYVEIDEEYLVKEALYKVFCDRHRVQVDTRELVEKIHKNINGGVHWTRTTRSFMRSWEVEKVTELVKEIREAYGL